MEDGLSPVLPVRTSQSIDQEQDPRVVARELDKTNSVELAPEPVLPQESAQVQPIATGLKEISIDAISKWTAVALVFLYVVGFLITSLNDFRFGFTQMNPLRPRILAAGGWFALFLTVPFAFVTEWRKHSLWKQNLSKWHKGAMLLFAYYILGNAVMIYSQYIFTFDNVSVPTGPNTAMWKIVLVVLGIIFAIVIIAIYYSRIPRWIVATSIFAYFGWTIGSSITDLFVKKMFLSNAPSFWILATGAIVFLEMRRRGWRPVLGDWPWSMVLFLVLMTMFATVYYPHIMPKWGGGAPLPISLTFSKESPIRGGQTVDCSLIDETDAGFYVIGKDELHATFIPRSQVSLVHFASGSEKSLFTIPSK